MAGKIDLSRVPSSMEQMAAGWAVKAAVQRAIVSGELVTREREAVRLSDLLNSEQARLEAHRAELERG